MTRPASQLASRSVIAAYFSVGVAIILLLVLTIWVAYRDLQSVRLESLKSEVDLLRAHAERVAGRIERDLQVREAVDLDEPDRFHWLRSYWQQVFPKQEQGLYAAVLDADGKILLHTDPEVAGRRLSRDWYSRVLHEVGDDVVVTKSRLLAEGRLAYDIRVPIKILDREVGEYHAGFGGDWFDARAAETRADLMWRHGLLIGGVLGVVVLASVSLMHIVRQFTQLNCIVNSASIARASEVGKLSAGLAHEIRNPLHAIKLNLHTFRRNYDKKIELPPDEMHEMLGQTIREIDRIEHLMRELVSFASPSEPRHEVIDLRSEIDDLVDFVDQEMLDTQIELHTHLPNGAVWAKINRGRLRQILLNLLQNAQQAIEQGGRIDVTLTRGQGRAEIIVADNGPGISEAECQEVFEPFFSTKPDGSGLGLALVKRFIDEVDGKIHCQPSQEGGACFRILLAESRPPRMKPK